MIEMKCPHCGHQLRIKDKYAGKRGGCKHCRGMFVVPAAETLETDMPELDFDFDLPMEPPAAKPPTAESGGEAPPPIGKFGPSPEDARTFKVGELAAKPEPEKPKAPGGEATYEAPTSSSLSQLDHLPDPEMEGVDTIETLGPTYWALAFLVPPVAFIWSFFVPKDHPHRAPGMITSIVFTLIAVSIFCVIYFGFGNNVIELQERWSAFDVGEGWGEGYEGQGEQSFLSDP